MAFNGAGAFIRAHDWTADADAAINIRADRMDEEDDGFATALSTCITKDGQTTTTASIPFAAGLSANALVDLSNAAAGQVKFPAAQNASSNVNTLDDYEEGTWSPTLLFGGLGAGITYDASGGRVGNYTKIGNRVIATGHFTLTSKGSSTGSATLSGLPFANNSTTGEYVVSNIFPFSLGTVSHPRGVLFPSATAITLYNTNGSTALADTDFTNISELAISISYRV